jgi:mRNA interferase MazF
VICSRWDVVVVPFPFTDRAAAKRRPALVISDDHFNHLIHHSVMAMITTADESVWPWDTPIDHNSAGLHHACVVRLKLFTLDNRLVIRRLGGLAMPDRAKIQDHLMRLFPGTPTPRSPC